VQRENKNEKVRQESKFQQKKEESMTEKELAAFWEISEPNSHLANLKIQKKVAQEMQNEKLKKSLMEQRSAPIGGVRRIIKEKNSKSIWAK